MTNNRQVWERKDTFALLGIFLGALLLRVAFVLVVRPVPVSDFGWYYTHALGIANGFGYTTNGYLTAYWPPGWPYFLAGIIRIFGPSVVAATIVQAVLNALTAGVVFLTGRTVAGRAAGIGGGIAYALLPSAIEWCSTLASEPLYTFLWAVVTYIWVSQSTKKLGWYAFSGVLLGAAALVRPSALLFWVILLVYLLTLKTERRYPARIAAVMAVTVGYLLLVVTPVIVRDYHIFGTLVVISNNGGISLYQGNNAASTSGDTELNDPKLQAMIDDPRTEVAANNIASGLAVQYIKSHPLHEVWLSIRKVKALYADDALVVHWTFGALQPPPDDRTMSSIVRFNNYTYFATMLFALLGIALCVIRKWSDTENQGWRLLVGMIVYNTLIFAMIFGLDRYRYPTMPYFAVFAGIGIAAALGYVRNGFAVRRVRTHSGA